MSRYLDYQDVTLLKTVIHLSQADDSIGTRKSNDCCRRFGGEEMKNHKLAQTIADASWSELVRQLEYKCQWYGRTLVKIDRWFPSSKRCGHCGHIVDKLPLDVREWDCPECGTHHDRDINAANNILATGLAVIVCGANIRPDGHKSKGQLRKTSLASRRGKKQKPKS
jgi:putative transposase